MRMYLLMLSCIFSIVVNAQVELPLLFSNDMVLQRDKPIPVWGWASANEQIEVVFHNQIHKTNANHHGRWKLDLNPEAAGGPFTLIIKGKNIIEISNVLVGEVWLCSGQSNMEFTVRQAKNFEEEVKDSNYPMIRQFYVENDMASQPKSKLKGGRWTVCNAENVAEFTAVGYYFAKEVYSKIKVPIGLIHASWGGTCVETWASKEALKSNKEFKAVIDKLPETDIHEIARIQKEKRRAAIEKLQGHPVSSKEESEYIKAVFNDKNWPEMQAPMLWENQQLGNIDGIVWMRKTFQLSKEDIDKDAVLYLAKVDDVDVTYVNGVEVGTTSQYDAQRVYKVPSGVLKEGNNVIAVKVIDYTGGGGIWGAPSELKLTTESRVVPLSDTWKFQVVELKSDVSPNDFPSLLYNAMINPLVPFAIQGVLWYQGEANVGRAVQYKDVFPLMIKDWRKQWKQGDFPFYFVQLSSFDEFGGNSMRGSRWAELREAQAATLEVKNTGMCVTTDIGNATDIHPKNKQDVGKRLAAVALNKTYGIAQVYSGPIFKGMEIKSPKVILNFNHIGSDLMVMPNDNALQGFEIAGTDEVFYPAKAQVVNNTVVVQSDKVLTPVAVRYGWADDAGLCNFYNKEGFPAMPFRTDSWNTITKKVKYLSSN
ncbi:sialate O-acetylesterase [Pseudotamlana carrageenivorans]|uniref:Sialate O-acetylesterase domain-containing protein n=1 Tax=Pseudotamlana carrageenivorans TaxID=2069432 RepID=A0A2I7SEM0_9FLAO|nr:sialate O-acetylesterase [Tamlana carrageenivorans]AUS04351.1 hypothetical protein C1A40_02180 [Tamlana carrageenivorans]